MLFHSGEDANPLNRRLPAEVVARRRREVRKPEEKPVDEVRVDSKTALLLKPEARLKWLAKACKMAEDGKASTTELHSIISSRKFAAGVHPKIGRRMAETVLENLGIFSDKQQKQSFNNKLHSIVSSRKFAAGVHPKIGRRMAEIVLENLGIFSDKQQKHLKSDEWFLGNTFGNNQGKGGDVDGDDQDHVHDERSHSQDKSGEDDCKVRKASEEHRGRDGGSGRRAREPEPEGWVEAPDAGRRDDRARQEALLAEDAKRKALAQQQAKKKQLEEEADSSLLALERLGQVTQPPLEPERKGDVTGKQVGQDQFAPSAGPGAGTVALVGKAVMAATRSL
eukprot:CAMPEP_0172936584 /NCGR_PEP_ID=MMETSP1075-20121228/222092_1 /TAXON_ID=2916 /ORGANISM="Ceratium fusus, Strain PA161109" /LENGTH=336 /DNA_ID=CAMNT_0013797957 /DNA_START=49 /DNA_END=1061 /DNA_ORIENTATION=-